MVNSHHSHELSLDPLSYLTHLQSLPEYKVQAAAARSWRTKVIPYSTTRRVLEDDEFGMLLRPRDYYNAVRSQLVDKTEVRSIAGLVAALQEAGFVYRTRVNVAYEGEVAVAKKLVQIWFAHPIQLRMARRFVSGFSLIINGTFNTNKLRLPLLVAVGSLHTGASFPVFFSFCPSEDRESFTFCWDSFKEECLRRPGDEVAGDPGVIIADWGQGLISSHNDAWPKTALQGCDWHAAQAIMKWLREKKYSQPELEGVYVVASDGNSVGSIGERTHIEGIKSFIWRYIKSANLPDLDVNRAALVDLLKNEHRYYIDVHWRKVEPRFIHYYTSTLPNLGSTSSQKVESYHPVVREFTNAALPLEKAVGALISGVKTWSQSVASEEAPSTRSYPRLYQGTDGEAFSLLKTKISLFAAKKIEQEWYEISRTLRGEEDNLGVCDCPLLKGFGLPCRHYLRRAFKSGEAIPRSLVYPRWWLGNQETHPHEWRPAYPNEVATRYHGGDEVVERSLQIEQIRSLLAPEEYSRFRAQELRVQSQLLGVAQSHLQLQQLPVGLPDSNPRHPGKLKRSGRVETGPERVEREATAERRATATVARQAAQALQLPILPPPPRPTTPPLKRLYEDIRSPGAPPTPARAAPVAPKIEESLDPFELPPSTAPAAVGRRSGRANQGRGWEALVPRGRGRGSKK